MLVLCFVFDMGLVRLLVFSLFLGLPRYDLCGIFFYFFWGDPLVVTMAVSIIPLLYFLVRWLAFGVAGNYGLKDGGRVHRNNVVRESCSVAGTELVALH
jgi:hypothetical protein